MPGTGSRKIRKATKRIEFPAVFSVLSALLSQPEVDRSRLADSLKQFEGELEGPHSSEGYAFTPFILHLIKTMQLESCVSTVLLEQLKSIARIAAVNSLSRDIAMQKVASALAEQDCKAILLKGVALDKYLYPDQAFRQGVDIDLLVTEIDFGRMEQILAGIAKKKDIFPGRPAHSRAAAQASFLVDTPIPVELDVHYQYAQSGIYRMDNELLFERSTRHPAYPSNLRLMAPEDNLVHFAIHGFKDKVLFQKQTIDAFLLIRTEEIDWNQLVERARSCAALMPLIYLVEGMRRVFNFQPPEEVHEVLTLKSVRGFLVNHLLAEKPAPGIRTGWKYRARQLGVTWLLSGNLKGYTRQQFNYLKNSVNDKLRRE